MALSIRFLISSRSCRHCVDHQRPAGQFEAEIDALGKRLRHQIPRHVAQHQFQIHRLHLVQLLEAGLGSRQCEKLIDQVGGAVGAVRNLLQRAVDLLRIGLVQGEIGLHLQTGERRAHLVRRVGDEALLRLQVLLQARHHVVERDDQRQHFLRHAARVDGRQIARRRRSMRRCRR